VYWVLTTTALGLALYALAVAFDLRVVYWALVTIAIGLVIFALGGLVAPRVYRVLRDYPEPRPSAQELLEHHPLVALPPLLALLGVTVLAIGLVSLLAWLLMTTLT
jgi:hypothetical protein